MKLIALILTAALGIVPEVICTSERPPAWSYPLAEMYVEACMELWEKDSGLNENAEVLVFDFTECKTLDKAQQEWLMETVGERFGVETRPGTFADLVSEGLIVYPDREERPHWCEFPTGLLISLSDERQGNGSVKFTLEKWRTPLGAYWLHDCTAISDDGVPETWSYTVGAEFIS